jgi:hypothetical protein
MTLRLEIGKSRVNTHGRVLRVNDRCNIHRIGRRSRLLSEIERF